MPLVSAILAPIRIAAALGMVALEFDRYRRTRRRPAGLVVSAAAIFLVISLLDVVLMAYISLFVREPAGTLAQATFRDEYALATIRPQDVVLIGDSFVWGQGVKKEERFGNQLEEIYAQRGSKTKVFSLGLVGIGPASYVSIVSDLPERVTPARIVMSFYMNDMPPIPNWHDAVAGMSTSLRGGSPTMGLVGDMLAKLAIRDVQAYEDFVVRCYDRTHPTFATRRAMLIDQLRRFRDLAAQRSQARPVFLILPLLTDFHHYPLHEAHRDLADTARSLEYDVLDLLPVFTARLGDGNPYRCDPNNNHFNADVHLLVAQELWKTLEAAR